MYLSTADHVGYITVEQSRLLHFYFFSYAAIHKINSSNRNFIAFSLQRERLQCGDDWLR